MGAPTLERVLTDAERLSFDEQEMLEELLRKRRIAAWRAQTASEAKKNITEFRSGKLKPQTVDQIIAQLRKGE